MSTHGCLEVISGATGSRRIVWLHTHHSGESIPKAVETAFDVLATYYSRVFKPEDVETEEDIITPAYNMLVFERLDYAPSAAALIIAAHPGLLEPLLDKYRCDLPKWSGLDRPYRLVIQKDTRWMLYGVDGELISEWMSHHEVIHRIFHRLRKGRKQA